MDRKGEEHPDYAATPRATPRATSRATSGSLSPDDHGLLDSTPRLTRTPVLVHETLEDGDLWLFEEERRPFPGDDLLIGFRERVDAGLSHGEVDLPPIADDADSAAAAAASTPPPATPPATAPPPPRAAAATTAASAAAQAAASRPGDTPEDWAVFDVLVRQSREQDQQNDDNQALVMKGALTDAMAHDVTTTLRSELAALQYKRDRLLSELQDMKGQLRCREQRALELQVESDQLREQAARQSSVIASLRKRVQELEERDRAATCSLGRSELAMQTLQRESRQAAERVVELESKLRRLELECHEEEGLKDSARSALSDLVRRLAAALGAELVDAAPETLLVRAAELVQEAGRLRARSVNMCESLQSAELELRNCREALQRQQAQHLMELDRVKQEKETADLQARCSERELVEVREKLAVTNRSLVACASNCAQQESSICALREEVKIREEKWLRLQNELRHLLESLAIMVSSPSRFVESTEGSIKDRIREILSDNKDLVVMDSLREKACGLQQQLGRQHEIAESSSCRARVLEEDKAILESRLHKTESDLAACDVARESLRRDKCTFMEFLDRLGRALNMEEVSKDIGVDMHTEALLVRAEQLARLESDKMVDKTAAVYQLQRRVRTLREQLQRRDLHLDLLRRKLALQVDSCRARALVESERDEISLRAKKLQKKVDCLQLQLAEARTLNRDLKAQLADAADCKITALERARKIEELQKRLVDAEMIRTQYNRKINLLKDQLRGTSQAAQQERSLSEHAAQLLREDLSSAKAALAEAARKENQLVSLRASVSKLLGVDLPATDYEIIARLQKLVAAHRDYTLVSRRYDDPLLIAPPCSPPPPPRPLSPPRSARCPLGPDDADLHSVLDDIDELNGIYKRPHRLVS